MIVRFPFAKPHGTPPFAGNEVEDGVTIDLDAKEVRGFYGAYRELPDDRTKPAERYTSERFVIKLTDEDVGMLEAAIDAEAANVRRPTRYEMRIAASTPVARCIVEPHDVPLSRSTLQAIAELVVMRAIEQGVGGATIDSKIRFD